MGAEQRAALRLVLAPRDARELRFISEGDRKQSSKAVGGDLAAGSSRGGARDALSRPAAVLSDRETARAKAMWYRHARSPLSSRLSNAQMLKEAGNERFYRGEYRDARRVRVP